MSQSSKEAKDAWEQRNKDKRPLINRNWKLRNVYGITPEQFDEMYEKQDGKCDICQRPIAWEPSGSSVGLHIDHNHTTRYVRGLLCNTCNQGIGQFGDSIELLERAIAYLKRTETPEDFVFAKVPNPKRKHTEEWKRQASERKRKLCQTPA